MDTVKNIGIVGAGMMGAEIALSFALSGREVLLGDVSLNLVNAGKKRLQGILGKWEEKGKINRDDSQKALSRIMPVDEYSGFDTVDLVIEAIIEEIAAKKKVFRDLDKVCKDTCIFASNTSSISISSLAGSTSRAERFIGMHFFSPASVMKLVEVIPGVDTSEDTIGKTMDIAREIGKEPIRVKDCAGFVVNRLLFAFFNESWRLVSEGIASPEDIDKAVKLGLGHPVGVFQLQDMGGLDLAVAVSNVLYEEYGERFRPSPLLKRKVAANHLGRKAKRGWYDYR
jgi:3-hydroxybutyryl-CoA dehydrogenase